ncbi:Phylloquinone omega-hydroxylase [Seminavis robusta]|uniref:Phylloquinone omega-hydroxylase n=1 Tax=Seminavis robusta TaxID=568900 RepID=A0A9N8DFD5_9STRA|nr:Phylloquinone omega-hydroxylase [Seminavis robusta]|eukprot:Sro62_g035570.1 Phylloquinone omega-hydroxylase (377) ;mRNA; r:120959-122089
MPVTFLWRPPINGMNFIAAKEGDRWKHARKSTSAAFSSENMKAMVDVVHTVMNKWIQDQLSSDDSSVDIDILSEMNKITSNVICEAAFDYDLKDDERETILDCLQICWREFGQKAMTNPWRKHHVTKWAFPGIRQGHRAAQQLHAHCTKMLHEYRTRIHTNPQPHKIIHMIHNDTAYENDDERVCDMVAYCIAGFDTTANTLAFGFRELALNQSEQTKLRETLQQCHTPEEARVAVKHVAKEMMRLYPAAATGSVRVLGEDMKVPGSASRLIPKGSIVLIPIYAVQRNPQVFGSNANDFVPERWENPSPEQMKAFVNFVAGKRNCQGQSLAMAETTEVLARLCRDYKFDIVEAGQAENIVLFKPVGTVLRATKVVV